MRRHLYFMLCWLVGLAAPALAQSAGNLSASSGKEGWYENKGQIKQTDGQAAPYVSHALERGNTRIFLLKPAGIAYQFERHHYPAGYQDLMAERHLDAEQMRQREELSKQIRLETYRMDMYLEGANPNARIETEGRSADYIQFYNHNVLDVHHYEKVVFKEVYPHIDWVVYTTEGGMKYDFVVRPGGNPADIKLRFKGQEELSLNAAGELVHGNRMGRFTEQRPVSFQGSKEVQTGFVLKGDLLTFELGGYDRSATLVIDPSRSWGTFYGGSGSDKVNSCATDGSDNVYIAGATTSTASIADGGHQTTYGGGANDAFLVKFNSSGLRQWGAYYGDTDDDRGMSCAVDGSGNVYLCGLTLSSTSIATGGHQNTYGGGGDAFLVKFNSSGVRQWGTYYGNNGSDWGFGCTVDGSDNVYMAGQTSSLSAIAAGGHQNTHGGNQIDAFLVKFNASGARQWGTYYGGSSMDYGMSCAVDGSGNPYLAGYTLSTDAIASGGHQNTHGGVFDGFLVKFNSSGARQWGTYYGDSGVDYGNYCAVDASENVYMCGTTYSTSAIASGGFQNTYGGANARDAYLVKFNSSGTRQWGTYYGGAGQEYGNFCALDLSGNVYLVGQTNTNTAGVIAACGSQNTFGGYTDGFMAKFNTSGVRQWGTFYGGSGEDVAMSCAVNGSGSMYLAGYTASTGTMASTGAHQTSYGGGSYDGFLCKFAPSAPCVTCPSNVVTTTDAGQCTTIATFANATAFGDEVTLTYSPTSGSTFSRGYNTVTVTATDNGGRTSTCGFFVVVFDVENPTISCPSNITTNVANGGCSANVTFQATATDNCSATVTYTPASGSTFNVGTTTVTAMATDVANRTATCTFTVTVVDNIAPTVSCPSNISVTAAPGQTSRTATFAATASDNCSATVSYSPASGSSFAVGATTVTATATDGAGNTSTCTFTVTVNEAVSIISPGNLSASTDAGQCSATVTFAATTTGVGVTIAYSPASGSVFNRGTTTVTATATDGAGNTATCSFTVTVNDTQAPILNCPGIVYATRTPGQNSGPATFTASVSDNCGSATVTFSPASGSIFQMGLTTVTATATDTVGNTATCTFIVSLARYLFVDHTATAGNQNGRSWNNAFLTVQAALAAATTNLDTILVAAGNYSPGATVASTYTLKPRVPMFGGFPNGLNPATWSWGQRNVAANPTILDGNGVNRRVVTATNLGSDPVMGVFDGFTVRGANGNAVAGGMYIGASAAGQVCSPVVRNCTFENNNAVNGGGVGVLASAGTANPTFQNCTFSGNNTTAVGGGLYFGPTKAGSINAVLTDCSFTNNSASKATSALARGGGLAAYSFGAGCTLFVTINGGSFANNFSESFGGGLLNYARAGGISQVTVNGTVFNGNAAASGGGTSLYCLGGQGTSTFNGATFNNNTASQNGGAANSYCELSASLGNLVFEGCLFNNNLAGFAGGAIGNSAQKSAVSNVTVSRCRFENNAATSRGGGVYALSTTNVAAQPATSTSSTVTNSVFVGNNGGGRGGALYNESALGSISNLQATNLTVAGNTAQNGAALFNMAPGALVATATATNSIFWANTCTDTTSRYFHGVGTGCGVALQNCLLPFATFTSNEVGTGSFTDLGGNISASPLFVSLANGDLHLQAGSPCIDAGTAVALSVDFDGNARSQGAGVDLGAYETAGNRPMARQPQTTTSALTATVFPNPTTGACTVSLDREVTGFAQLFDLQGRLVASEQLNGVNQTQFDLGGMSAGSYLLRIVSGDAVVTKQVMVARP